MRKVVLVVALGLLTLGIGGCGSGEEEISESPPETASPESSPTQPETGSEAIVGTNEQETASEPEKEAFEEPLVAQQEEAAAKAGLTQSTQPEERLLQLKGSTNGNGTAAAPAGVPNQSVSDPFEVLPPLVVRSSEEVSIEALNLTAQALEEFPEVPVAAAPPEWTVDVDVAAAPPELEPKQVPSLPEVQVAATPQWRVASAPQRVATGEGGLPNQSPQQVPSLPEVPVAELPASGRPGTAQANLPFLPSLPQIPDLTVAQVPTLPELPQNEPVPQWRDPNPPPVVTTPVAPVPLPPSTEIARAISVSGVMQVGEETRVILKAPTEPTSRYVSVGERIANGQVLVKRVKFNVGGEPIVVFEQNGVEVAIEVGTFAESDDGLNLMMPSSPGLNSFTPS